MQFVSEVKWMRNFFNQFLFPIPVHFDIAFAVYSVGCCVRVLWFGCSETWHGSVNIVSQRKLIKYFWHNLVRQRRRLFNSIKFELGRPSIRVEIPNTNLSILFILFLSICLHENPQRSANWEWYESIIVVPINHDEKCQNEFDEFEYESDGNRFDESHTTGQCRG